MTPGFIDTHCHFDFPPFRGEEETSLARAAAGNVRHIIVPAVCADRFETVLGLGRRYAQLSAALGLHPLYIADHHEQDVERLAALLQQGRSDVAAVGEIGLDLFMEQPRLPQQIALLQSQLHLARRYDLPVILHSRRSHDQLARELKRASLPRRGVVHGFAGSLEQAQAFVRLGYCIGVGGTITYERAQKTRRTIAQLPLSCLLLETDAPDMPPAGYQGQPNRPERITQVFQALCELRPEAPADIAAAVFNNSKTLFSLPL